MNSGLLVTGDLECNPEMVRHDETNTVPLNHLWHMNKEYRPKKDAVTYLNVTMEAATIHKTAKTAKVGNSNCFIAT